MQELTFAGTAYGHPEDGTLKSAERITTKDLRDFRACPEVARRGCRSREIRVPVPY